jgi:hypothetical protein
MDIKEAGIKKAGIKVTVITGMIHIEIPTLTGAISR